MAIEITESDKYREAFDRVHASTALPEKSVIMKSEALERFIRGGFPNTRSERWKYTDLGIAAERARTVALPIPQTADLPDGTQWAEDCTTIIARNGQYLETPDLPPGIRIETGPAAVASTLRAPVPMPGRDALADLNAAFIADSLVLDISHTPATPICIHHLIDSGAGAVHIRMAIRVAAGVNASVIEVYEGSGDTLTNAITDISISANGQLSHTRVQADSHGSVHLGATSIHLASDASAAVRALELGGSLARLDLAAHLDGPGADIDISSLVLAPRETHGDHHIDIDHSAPKTRSRVTSRCVAGHGRAVMNGRIHVCEGAQQTDAGLVNHNLVLSATGEIDAKPELEIYADDVSCSHGSTTGQLDEDALFYLQSRGIAVEDARRLLVQAFVSAVTSNVPSSPIERLADDALTRLLGECDE